MERQMKLIGAGLPRTATLTQKIALEMLGIGPCYHMVNILSDMSLVPTWIDAFEGRSNWDQVFEGHQATVDWPGAFFYRDLVEAYPDAKVLLSVRDGESWACSMRKTIWGVIYGDTMMRDLSTARTRIDPGWSSYIELMTAMWDKSGLLGAAESFEASALARAMGRYNDEVREFVPAERLLVWSPADGWEPLCEFLGAPVPSAPLPHVNDAAMFAHRIIDGAMAALTGWQEQQRAPSAAR
jgi:Sulfotransferase domain